MEEWECADHGIFNEDTVVMIENRWNDKVRFECPHCGEEIKERESDEPFIVIDGESIQGVVEPPSEV